MVDASWFVNRLPPKDTLDEVLGGDPLTALLDVARDRAPVEIGFLGQPDNPEDDPEITAMFALATQAAAKLQANPSALLSTSEEEALHLFVHLVGRPALRTFEGDLPAPPQTWKQLSQDRPVIADLMRGVGRLDEPDRTPCGTGWFIAKDLIITNNHVVSGLCGISPHHDSDWRSKLTAAAPIHSQKWEQEADQRPVWDPGDSPPGSGCVGRVRKIRALHETFDAALLEVEGIDHSEERVLTLSEADAEPAGLPVYLVGYPAAFEWSTHPSVLKLLFGGASSIVHKRVSPGELQGDVSGEHDASTLGGSSGSPVVAFADHRVRALHFSGRYGTANYAVPFWKLAGDPFLVDNGIALGGP